MQQLHLVGFTTDLEGLIFSTRKGAKSGGFMVLLDEQLLDSIEDAQRLREDRDSGQPSEFPLAEEAPEPNMLVRRRPRPQSELSPREIQARLRAGNTVSDVAREAGVDEEWVLRFAPPIVAEQAQVVERAQQLTFVKTRLGPSSQPLGTSVRWNLADRGVHLSDEELDEAWSAFNLHGTTWVVRFSFVSRRRRQTAEWQVDLRSSELSAGNRLGSELGYVEPGRTRRRPPTEGAPREAPAKSRAAGAKAAKRSPPARKAATKATKKVAKKAGPRAAPAKRPPAEGQAGAPSDDAAPPAPLQDRPTHLARPPSPMNTTNRLIAAPASGRSGWSPPTPPPAASRAGRETGPARPAAGRRPPQAPPAARRPLADRRPPEPQSTPARRAEARPAPPEPADVEPPRPRPTAPPPAAEPHEVVADSDAEPPRSPVRPMPPAGEEDRRRQAPRPAPPPEPPEPPGVRAAPPRRPPGAPDAERDPRPPAVVILPPPEEPEAAAQAAPPPRQPRRSAPPAGEELVWEGATPEGEGPAVRIRADLAEGGATPVSGEAPEGEDAAEESGRGRRRDGRRRPLRAR